MINLSNNFTFFDEKDATVITPSMAQYLLDHNACIKPLNHQAVTKLVHELKTGNFDFNGATIVLNSDHRLVDGRARLTACVESGISFKAFIVTGIGESAQYTKDTGRSRNVAQYLGSNGYKNPRMLTACANILHNMLTITGDYDGLVERTNHQATSQEILQVIADHPKLVECVDRIMPLKKNYITSETKHLIVLDYLCRYVDNRPDLADEFLEVLSMGRVVEVDHPVFQLRITLTSNLLRVSQKMIGKTQVMYMIKAYNLLKEGKQCKRLLLGAQTPRLFMLRNAEAHND